MQRRRYSWTSCSLPMPRTSSSTASSRVVLSRTASRTRNLRVTSRQLARTELRASSRAPEMFSSFSPSAEAHRLVIHHRLNLSIRPVEHTASFRRFADCSAGVVHPTHQVCCNATCGLCGGHGCSGRPGGPRQCCMPAILRTGRVCESRAEVACILRGSSNPFSDTSSATTSTALADGHTILLQAPTASQIWRPASFELGPPFFIHAPHSSPGYRTIRPRLAAALSRLTPAAPANIPRDVIFVLASNRHNENSSHLQKAYDAMRVPYHQIGTGIHKWTRRLSL